MRGGSRKSPGQQSREGAVSQEAQTGRCPLLHMGHRWDRSQAPIRGFGGQGGPGRASSSLPELDAGNWGPQFTPGLPEAS